MSKNLEKRYGVRPFLAYFAVPLNSLFVNYSWDHWIMSFLASPRVVLQAIFKNDERVPKYGSPSSFRVRTWLCTSSLLTDLSFSIKVKPVKLSYHAEEVFNIDIPNLQHGNDGLIYTSVNTPYLPGTDRNMCVSTRSIRLSREL